MPCQADLQVQIELFYVSENHQLSSSITNDSTGIWWNEDSLTKYTTAPNTRSLSVTSNIQVISNATNDPPDFTTTMAVLFYETLNGSVAVLSRIAQECSTLPATLCFPHASEEDIYPGYNRNLSWIDNSAALRTSCNSVNCTTPFASSQNTVGTNFSVKTYFRSYLEKVPQHDIQSIIYLPLENSKNPYIQVTGKYQ